MNSWILVLAGLTAAVCALMAVRQRRKTRKLMQGLSQMLDEAIDGTFTEKTFDESMRSAVECKLNRYLSASAVSARNLAGEKTKIQELLTDISHQTKTPIANILLYAQLLETQDLSPDGRDCAAALHRQAEKLSFLITALVKLSRLETGVFTMHPVPGPVAPLLEGAVEQFASKAAQKGVALTLGPAEGDAVLDPKWTAEVIGNLVDNAVKYTPAGGSVCLSSRDYDLFCRVDVADTGPGISEKEQARIFTRFYRSPSAAGQEGVGIGLYLVRQVLEEEGGYVKVASGPGGGAVFSVFLPRVQP